MAMFVWQGKARLSKLVVTAFFYLTVLSALFVSLESLYFEKAVHQAVSLLFAGLYLMLVASMKSLQQVFFLFKAVLIAAVVNAVITIIAGKFPSILDGLVYKHSLFGRDMLGFSLPFVRNAGLLNHYGYNAAFQITALFLLLILMELGEIKRSLGIIIALVEFFALLVTQSRATWLAFFVFASFTLVRYMINAKSVKKMAYIGVFIALIAVTTYMFLPAFEWLINIKARSFYERIDQYREGIEYFLDSPIFGSGFGVYFATSPDHVLHNGWITILYSTGLVGISIFLIVWTLPLFRVKMFETRMRVVSLILPIAVIISASSGLSYYSVWLALGIVYLFAINRKYAFTKGRGKSTNVVTTNSSYFDPPKQYEGRDLNHGGRRIR